MMKNLSSVQNRTLEANHSVDSIQFIEGITTHNKGKAVSTINSSNLEAIQVNPTLVDSVLSVQSFDNMENQSEFKEEIPPLSDSNLDEEINESTTSWGMDEYLHIQIVYAHVDLPFALLHNHSDHLDEYLHVPTAQVSNEESSGQFPAQSKKSSVFVSDIMENQNESKDIIDKVGLEFKKDKPTEGVPLNHKLGP